MIHRFFSLGSKNFENSLKMQPQGKNLTPSFGTDFPQNGHSEAPDIIVYGGHLIFYWLFFQCIEFS